MYACTAENLYSTIRSRGQRSRIWAALCGRSRRLRTLAEAEAASVVCERNYVGVRSVPIDQIRGSEGRSADFDRDFCPLQDRTRGRWLGIARARQAGKSLPPVLLVQVGEVYYVRDGHHRISVARALGQRTIEAKVTVWHVRTRSGANNRKQLSRSTAATQPVHMANIEILRVPDASGQWVDLYL